MSTIALSHMNGGAGLTPVRNPEGASRADGWLRQMELARLAEMNRAHAPGAASAPPAPTRPPAPMLPTASAVQANAQGAPSPAAPRAAPRALAAYTPQTWPGAAPSGPTPAPTAPPTGAYALEFDHGGGAQDEAEVPAKPPPSPAAQHRAAPGRPGQADMEPAEPPVKGAETAASWQKRLMHLSGEGHDIDVWIRDAQLGAEQAGQVVHRLAQDMRDAGMRLRAATVNGKIVFRGAPSPAPATESPPFTVTPTEEDHGTR